MYIAASQGQTTPRGQNFDLNRNLITLVICYKFQENLFGSGENFLRFLPYMGMAAILIMWPELFEQTFVPPSHGGSIWNLASIGPVVSEEMFENVDNTHTHTNS